tara:strand:+ start:15125 stop:16540 length:1416 start_codon:yes stop_codon:yes gene_type:complete
MTAGTGSPKRFREASRTALNNERLQRAMNRLQSGFGEARAQAIADLPEFDALRDLARQRKDFTLRHLPQYLAAFEQAVRRAGGRVHWAKTPQEANRIVRGLCQEYDCRHVVKSKSMVGEEMRLADYLLGWGADVIETDLGEYILQLRQEKPSHIIAPATHLNRDDIAETFQAAHGEDGQQGKAAEGLVQEARHRLRQKFKQAEMAITGANFLVAETGTVVLVTNEGNADLGVTLAPHHVVVSSIEKVVPTLKDAFLFLRLLARSATGQDISTYTSLYTGRRRDGATDGPETFDVVLLDGGRSDLLDSEFEEILHCIRCGACLNHCPVYAGAGGHAYGSIYPGPMGAVLAPALHDGTVYRELSQASTFCGKCEEVCPVRIPLPKLMRYWREKSFGDHQSPFTERVMLRGWAWLCRHPHLYRSVIRLMSSLLRRLSHGGWITSLPGLGRAWTQDRDMPAPPAKTFFEEWEDKR